MSQDLPARMLRLLSLLQTRREWSGAELARRLGVTGRTLRRDIERLRELGYPVEGTPGHAGGYRMGPGADMPPLLLDDDEAVAIAVALRTAAAGVAGLAETALRALVKLEQVMPQRLRSKVTAVHRAAEPLYVGTPGDASQVDSAVLLVLAGACRDHEIVTFDYITRHGTGGRRRVEPHGLVAAWGRWYLVGYDTDKDGWRIYRLDRLSDPAPTGRRVPPRALPANDTASYVAAKIVAAPTRYRVTATVHAPADHLRNRGALPGRIVPVNATTCAVDLSSDSLAGITQHLATFDADYTLDADPDVLDHLHDAATRLQQAARRAGA